MGATVNTAHKDNDAGKNRLKSMATAYMRRMTLGAMEMPPQEAASSVNHWLRTVN
jgi:hypothetical protein